jgi:serine/threonine protein kinase
LTLASGARLGPYEIVAPLGAGGMGEVYRARDPRLGREVAVKVLPSEVARDPERLRRFEQEARAASALNHPNILTVHDVGAAGGTSYLVTELLEGESLRALLRRGALPPQRAVELALQSARGLAAAHEKGIVHRDLKPENLFLTGDGVVKILDFGLARLAPEPTSASALARAPTVENLTGEGAVLGTIGYMSPEQVRGEPADARSDLFSLGCVLVEMLSGKRAFAGESAVDTMHAILHDEPDAAESLAGAPTALGDLVSRCLEKRREKRFQSAADLASPSSTSTRRLRDPRSPAQRRVSVADARSFWPAARHCSSRSCSRRSPFICGRKTARVPPSPPTSASPCCPSTCRPRLAQSSLPSPTASPRPSSSSSRGCRSFSSRLG